MKQLVLHVGMPKTATTTIQHTIASQSRELLADGALFPKTGRPREATPAHHSLFLPVASSRQAIRTPLPEPEDTFEGMQRRVEEERRKAGATSLILSSEMLWNPAAFDRSALTRIRDAFRSDEFVVLPYLRPVESHVVSGYAQRVTGPQCFTGSFSEHVSTMLESGIYDYDKRLDDFADVFGKDAVRPVWLPWLNRDVLSPFRDIFPVLADVATGKDRNSRRSWIYVAARRRVNALQKSRVRRLGSLSRRMLNGFGRFDPLVRKSSILESATNPMDAGTRKLLEEKTKMMLDVLAEKYDLTEPHVSASSA